MKSVRHILRYLTVISLILVACSGICDLIMGFRAAGSYLAWRKESGYGCPGSLIASTYLLSLIRGTCVTLGCGVIGLIQAVRGRIQTGYLLFSGFCTTQYILSVVHKAYKGFAADDLLQMWVIVACFVLLLINKGMQHRKAPRQPRTAP